MCKTIVASDDKSVKCVVLVQIGLVGLVSESGCFCFAVSCADILCLLRQKKLYLILRACDLRDGDLQRQIILFGDIAQAKLLGRNEDIKNVTGNPVDLQRSDKCFKCNVTYVMFSFDGK